MSAILLQNEAARPGRHLVIDAQDRLAELELFSFSGGSLGVVAVEGYEPDPMQAPESAAEGGEGRGGHQWPAGGAPHCASLTCEQCAQIIGEGSHHGRREVVRQGRFGSMKDNFPANHHHH